MWRASGCCWCSVSWSGFHSVRIHLAVHLAFMYFSICVLYFNKFYIKKTTCGQYMWVQNTEVWQSKFWDGLTKIGWWRWIWDPTEKCGCRQGERSKCVILKGGGDGAGRGHKVLCWRRNPRMTHKEKCMWWDTVRRKFRFWYALGNYCFSFHNF